MGKVAVKTKIAKMMKNSIKIALSLLPIVSLVIMPMVAVAQVPHDPFAGSDAPIQEISDVNAVIETIYNWVVGVFWVVSAGFLIWAAMLYATARGGEEQVKKAKNVLIYALVGIAVAVAATGMRSFITNLLSGGAA